MIQQVKATVFPTSFNALDEKFVLAAENNRADLMTEYMKQGTIGDNAIMLSLISGAQLGYVSVVDVLIDAGISVHLTIDDDDEYPLLLACQFGHTQVVTSLLKAGAMPCVNESLSLCMACKFGHVDIIKQIIESCPQSIYTASPSIFKIAKNSKIRNILKKAYKENH